MNETNAADYKVLSTEAYVALNAFKVIDYLEKSTSVYAWGVLEHYSCSTGKTYRRSNNLGEDEAEWEGSSDVEVTLKATISLMNKSNITVGKSLMLQKAHERL